MMNDDKLLRKLEKYDNEAIANLIDKHIKGRNAERNRKILKRRIIDGICYEPLSEEFDLSVRQTQNIIYKCISQLLFVI